MRLGTTPTHTFTLPIDTSIIKEVKICYAQGGQTILEKRTGACTMQEGAVVVKLTQEETFMFNPCKLVHIQVRVLTLGGDALTSDEIVVSLEKCLDDEVLA